MAETFSRLSTALVGRYDIERELGEGGMATVYLARDARHQRHVALKVLKPELGAVLGVERFLAEIRVTANLQHPNLLPLFDSGEADGLLFYVMPYVEGESLRARLDREKQLPIDDALRIATSVAMALDYAHRHGVVHRDLKPENILLHDEQALVADFGIALAVSNAAGNRFTQTGLSLGTPLYMSPEQATGDRALDGRTDIYSLGAVLYEMLTGEPPHTGSSSQAIIARVLTETPRGVRVSRPAVARHIEGAVACSLEKLAADRFVLAREFADALNGRAPVTTSMGERRGEMSDAHQGVSVRLPAKVATSVKWLALALLAAIGAWGWLRPRPSSEPATRVRFPLVLADSEPLRTDIPGANLALSPDGTQLVYVGGQPTARLYMRGLNDLEARLIPGTERGTQPRFSPDGRWLAFVVGNQLKKLTLPGGQVSTIADNVSRYSWGDGDVIVFARARGGLYRVSAGGGPVAEVSQVDTTRRERHSWPDVLPGGQAAIFTIHTDSGAMPEVAAVRLRDGVITRLGVHGVNPRFVATGHIVLGRLDAGAVDAVPFDAGRLRVTGPSVTVLEGVMVKLGGATEIAVSRSGSLVYVEVTGSQLVRVDQSGHVRPILTGPGRYAVPRFSPIGDLITLGVNETGGASDVWVYSLASGTLTKLTRDGNSTSPVWTGDGRRIAWVFTKGRKERSAENRSEIRWQSKDGAGSPETLAEGASDFRSVDFPTQRDFFVAAAPRGVWVSAAMRSGDGRLVLEGLEGIGAQLQFEMSPDGRWLAYRSFESGDPNVYVTALSGGGRYQVSVGGGREPAWAPDARTLFYRSDSHLMAATIRTDPEFVVVRRDTMFADNFLRGVERTNYDVLQGNEFLMVRRDSDQQRAVVVIGWFHELRERMAQATSR